MKGTGGRGGRREGRGQVGGRRKERGKGTGRGVVEKESDREGDVAVGGRRKERRKEERAEREEGRNEILLNATLSPRE